MNATWIKQIDENSGCAVEAASSCDRKAPFTVRRARWSDRSASLNLKASSRLRGLFSAFQCFVSASNQ